MEPMRPMGQYRQDKVMDFARLPRTANRLGAKLCLPLCVTLLACLACMSLPASPRQESPTPAENISAPSPSGLPPAASAADAAGPLLALADAFGERLEGAVWIPAGSALGGELSRTPLARASASIPAGEIVWGASRLLSGLPLPADAWPRVLQGPTLMIWVRPQAGVRNGGARPAQDVPSESAVDSSPDSSSDVPAGNLPPGAPPPPQPGNSDPASTSSAKASVERPEMVVLVNLGDASARREVIRWLASEGVAQARRLHPGLSARRRWVAGAMLHRWDAPRRSILHGPGSILAYAQAGSLLIVASEERIVSEVLARRRELGLRGESDLHHPVSDASVAAAIFPDAATPSPGPASSPLLSPSDAATAVPLSAALRHIVDETAESGAAAACVFHPKGFIDLQSHEWLVRGFGLGPLIRAAEQLAEVEVSEASSSSTTSAPAQALKRADEFLRQHNPASLFQGGAADLQRIEGFYWPGESECRSRFRLIFRQSARTWMQSLRDPAPLQMDCLAPENAISFWALRAPRPFPKVGGAAAQPPGHGAEIGSMRLPTRRRLAAVNLVEEPAAAEFVRMQSAKAEDFITSLTHRLVRPAAAAAGSRDPAALAAEAIERLRFFIPGLGVAQYRVRPVGDFLAVSNSHEALRALGAVERGEGLSLRGAGMREFASGAPFALGSAASASESIPIFIRYMDWGRRARSLRPADWFVLIPQDEWGDEGTPFEINWLALAQTLPQARELLGSLPPHRTVMRWHPVECALSIETSSASGLPGDPAVWSAMGATLLPVADTERLTAPLRALQRLEPPKWPKFLPGLKKSTPEETETPGAEEVH